MAIKLIAFDMDDTLLRGDRTIGARTLAALHAAHEKGVRIVPATGRGRSTMWNYVEEMGCADAAICTNHLQQTVSIGGFQFGQHPIIHDCRDNGMLVFQFFQHICVGGIAGLCLLHRR